MVGRQPLKASLDGYERAAPAERASFWMLSACAVTIGAARAITYGQERDRSAPRVRSLARRAAQAVEAGGLRVHHFLPGIGLTIATGATAILSRGDQREFPLSVPFGIGAGLILDEVGLLVKSDNPYWSTQTLALVEGALAALGAALLAVRFHRRGTALDPPPGPGEMAAMEIDTPLP